MAAKPDLEFKVVFIGDSGVGKTCILSRLDTGSYTPSTVSTIGMDMLTKTVQSGTYSVKLKLWDTAGQERFRSMVRLHSRGARGIFIVYSVDDRTTFEAVTEFYNSLMADNADSKPVCALVANKADLVDSRLVSRKQGKELAKQLGLPFFECSAKTGDGIGDLLQYMADELVAKVESVQTPMPRREKTGLLENSPFRVEANANASNTTAENSSCGC